MRLDNKRLARECQRSLISYVCLSILTLLNAVPSHLQPQAPVANDLQQSNLRIIIPNLPPHHYQFWLKNHPRALKEYEAICSQAKDDPTVFSDLSKYQQLYSKLYFENPDQMFHLPYGISVHNTICSKIGIVNKSCWGYETNCQEIHLMPECHGSSYGEAKSEQEQKIAWFSSADFGYILERRKELSKYCSPDRRANHSVASSLECTKHFQMCRGEDLYMNLQDITPEENMFHRLGNSSNNSNKRFMTFKEGDIGGWNCDLQLKRIKEEGGQRENLQSWFNELENYNLIQSIQPDKACEVTIQKQAFLVKLNSASNMYDYFSSFINLYATIHMNNRFSEDNQIIMWDKLPISNKFKAMWYAFSKNPPISIGAYRGKRVCLKKFIFAIPPKTIGGLFHNNSLISGCSKSGLFNAFSHHVLHRFPYQTYDLPYHMKTRNNLVRITILSRPQTGVRSILNEVELRQAIANVSKQHFVQLENLNNMDFQKALMIIVNTDVLIGMHGAELTYSLFLPGYAHVIELNNFGESRYRDLSRLRGVNYLTLENEKGDYLEKVTVPEDSSYGQNLKRSKLLGHDKYSNYRLNVDAFLPVLMRVIEQTKQSRAKYFGQPINLDPQDSPERRSKTSHLQASITNTTTSNPKSTTTTAPKLATMTAAGGESNSSTNHVHSEL